MSRNTNDFLEILSDDRQSHNQELLDLMNSTMLEIEGRRPSFEHLSYKESLKIIFSEEFSGKIMELYDDLSCDWHDKDKWELYLAYAGFLFDIHYVVFGTWNVVMRFIENNSSCLNEEICGLTGDECISGMSDRAKKYIEEMLPNAKFLLLEKLRREGKEHKALELLHYEKQKILIAGLYDSNSTKEICIKELCKESPKELGEFIRLANAFSDVLCSEDENLYEFNEDELRSLFWWFCLPPLFYRQIVTNQLEQLCDKYHLIDEEMSSKISDVLLGENAKEIFSNIQSFIEKWQVLFGCDDESVTCVKDKRTYSSTLHYNLNLSEEQLKFLYDKLKDGVEMLSDSHIDKIDNVLFLYDKTSFESFKFVFGACGDRLPKGYSPLIWINKAQKGDVNKKALIYLLNKLGIDDVTNNTGSGNKWDCINNCFLFPPKEYIECLHDDASYVLPNDFMSSKFKTNNMGKISDDSKSKKAIDEIIYKMKRI